MTFTLNPLPEASSAGCTSGMAAIGYFVNGVAYYGWGDGVSYNSAGVWNNAVVIKIVVIIICLGCSL